MNEKQRNMPTWLKLLTAAVAVVAISTVTILGVNAIRADQAAQAEAAEQAAIAAQEQAEFEALAIKFAEPAHYDMPKAPPPPPPVEEPPADDGGAVVNEDGSVSGEGCPAPYVSDEHGCHSPICQVLEDGTEIPCQSAVEPGRVYLGA